MKKKKSIVFALFVTLVMVISLVCVKTLDYKSLDANIANKKSDEVSLENVDAKYKINYDATYLYVTPDDLYEHSEYVVIVTYKKDLKTFAYSGTGLPTTISNFVVDEVIKGNVGTKEISVAYLGGKITLEEYMKNKTYEQLKKNGIENITKKQAKTEYIELVSEDVAITFKEEDNQKYMLFLAYDKENDVYWALANGYGMLKINEDGLIYSKVKEEYIPPIIYHENGEIEVFYRK